MPEKNPFDDDKDAAKINDTPKNVTSADVNPKYPDLKVVVSQNVLPEQDGDEGKQELGDKDAKQTRYVRIKNVTEKYGNVFVCSLVQVTKALVIMLCIVTTMLYLGSSVCFRIQLGTPPLVFFPITLLCVCLFACIQYIVHGCGFGSAQRRLYGILDITITSVLAVCATAATILTTIKCEPSLTSTAITVTIGYVISLVLIISAVITYFKVIRKRPAVPEQVEEPVVAP